MIHPSLRVDRRRTGATVADLRDEGLELSGVRVLARARATRGSRSPTSGAASERPAIWDVATGELVDLPLDLVGPHRARRLVAGRRRRCCCSSSSTAATTSTATTSRPARSRRSTPSRARSRRAAVRPDGEVWYRRPQRASTRRAILAVGSTTPILEADGPRGAGRPRRSSRGGSTNPNGQRVHGFIVAPGRRRPVPGRDARPRRPALARHRPLVARRPGPRRRRVPRRDGQLPRLDRVRAAWRDALTGNIGFLELEDVLAGLDDLIARGIADPARVVLAGWSWGGYVTLLGTAATPSGWSRGSRACRSPTTSPPTRTRRRSSRRSTGRCSAARPTTMPELFRERKPITYVEASTAPLLILAGENDSPLPDPPGLELRRAAAGPRPRATRCTRTRPATRRSTSTSG